MTAADRDRIEPRHLTDADKNDFRAKPSMSTVDRIVARHIAAEKRRKHDPDLIDAADALRRVEWFIEHNPNAADADMLDGIRAAIRGEDA